MSLCRELRTARNLSLEKLAAKSGVSLSTVRRLDAGGDVTMSSLRKVCKVLRVHPGIFFDPVGSKSSKAS